MILIYFNVFWFADPEILSILFFTMTSHQGVEYYSTFSASRWKTIIQVCSSIASKLRLGAKQLGEMNALEVTWGRKKSEGVAQPDCTKGPIIGLDIYLEGRTVGDWMSACRNMEAEM